MLIAARQIHDLRFGGWCLGAQLFDHFIDFHLLLFAVKQEVRGFVSVQIGNRPVLMNGQDRENTGYTALFGEQGQTVLFGVLR
ncbi:hypothetical protein D3C75_1119180 [compost metagenome]